MTNRQMSEIIRRQKPTTLRPTATVQAAVCPHLSPTLRNDSHGCKGAS
jgi:hypothetical protein